ncbi:MAG: PEP-CTERM sorting domain-containing protein [Planctomycetes bacterium]|nr:PEP-CTERM sorting domain-containing protein [Planctomycetota bacterium]
MKRFIAIAPILALGAAAFAAEPFSVIADPTSVDFDPGPFGGISGEVFWDNGDTDGSNGYSNFASTPFGSRRTLLDAFIITDPGGWILSDLHTYQVWDTFPPGSGSGFELTIWSDAGGAPGAPLVSARSISYTEAATGRTWFGRREYEMTYEFGTLLLEPGAYWIEGNAVGPENNFWMVRSQVTRSECWVNYDDLGGLQPGSALFGVPADLSFALTGRVPEPATLTLLAVGCLVLVRRRSGTTTKRRKP